MKPKAFLCLNVHSDQAPEEIFCSWDYYLNIKITNSSPPAFSEIQSQRWLMHCFPASHYSQQWWMHCPLALHYSHHNIMNSYNIGYHKSLFTPAWKLQYDMVVSCYGLSQSYGSEKRTVFLRRDLSNYVSGQNVLDHTWQTSDGLTLSYWRFHIKGLKHIL